MDRIARRIRNEGRDVNQSVLIFDAPPRSRRTDPPSSRRAESEMNRSGAMRGQRVICLQLIEKYPGRTSKELAELGTLDRYQVARRAPELQANVSSENDASGV